MIDSSDEVIKQKLNLVWTKLLEEIKSEPEFSEVPKALNWIIHVLTENVSNGKQTRPVAFVHMCQAFTDTNNNAEEDELRIYVLAWCLEILQIYSLIADDIMDNSETRRGKPCWYRVEGVGMNAVNDAFLLMDIAYFLLGKYFMTNSYFPQLLRVIQRAVFRTNIGQNLDAQAERRFDEYTEDNYCKIVSYKTSLVTSFSPALLLGGKHMVHEKIVDTILNRFGKLLQGINDYLDVYGSFKSTGKIGTDIADGKCTWLIVKAFQLGSVEQVQELKEHYGIPNKESEEVIKRIFGEVGIKNEFAIHERTLLKEINELIQTLPSTIPKEPFFWLLEKWYKRYVV